jgi:hypothetical protein
VRFMTAESRYAKPVMQQRVPPEQRWSTPAEFCGEHNISRWKYYEEVRSGRLEVTRLGPRTSRISPEAKARWRAAAGIRGG